MERQPRRDTIEERVHMLASLRTARRTNVAAADADAYALGMLGPRPAIGDCGILHW